MKPDERLVEDTARAAYEADRKVQNHGVPWIKLGRGARDKWRVIARAAIDAINASGTHLVVCRCQPVWGSCGLPAGHGGQHNAYAHLAEQAAPGTSEE